MQKLYVLGHPIDHSKSPVMHNAVYRELGLDWEYGKADFPAEFQAQAFLEVRDFLGINITTPFKPLALAAAAWAHPLARLAGGANVLVSREDGLYAYNTDGMGCVRYLQSQGAPLKGASVAVCGTGPTSFSIAGAAEAAGARVLVLGRNAGKSKRAVADWRATYNGIHDPEGSARRAPAPHVQGAARDCLISQADGASTLLDPAISGGGYDENLDAIAAADLIIDATPLGMKAGDPAPFDVSVLRKGQWVFDAVYGHGETALAASARAAGCNFRSGEGMLVGQAVLAVQLFLQAAGVRDALGFDKMSKIMHDAAFGSL